ncbi:MAG: hypothetical protein Q8M92_04580, partial [Candidatus Subteraquimicrobiales bacterium]|nr:hypothetical protein [Candidatus Subteraquimicrobiales bacterium]
MTYKEMLVRSEQKQFELDIWLDRLVRAKSARSDWDSDYEIASAILSNKLATAKAKNELSGFTDMMFHTNWLLKLCIWLESYIMSADIFAGLKSHAGSDYTYPDRLMLEIELNEVLSKYEMFRAWSVRVIPDRIRFGYGCSYSGWNSKARDAYWRNGKPNFLALDARRVWVDESTSDVNFNDRRWVFAKVEFDLDDAKELFPDKAKELFPDKASKIGETHAIIREGDSSYKKDKFDMYICQYSRKKSVRFIDVEVILDGKKEIQQVLLEQLQDFLDDNHDREFPDNMRVLESDDPDNPGYDAEINAVYQFKFSYDYKMLLSEVEYVGDIDQFQFWTYHRIEDDIYPRGTSYMLKDEQTIKAILLTKAAIEVIKNGRKTPIIKEGSLVAEDEFIEKHNSLDYVGKISAEWYES